MTKADIIYKCENNIPFTIEEMKLMIFEDIDGVEKVQPYEMIDKGRWDLLIETVIKIDNRYFSILWNEGATEMQENYFYDNITEVIPVPIQKISYMEKGDISNDTI